jgi:type I restriction enzyme S subunit
LQFLARKFFQQFASTVTTVQSLNTPQLEELPIPLPPLDIQSTLVAALEAARKSRREKLAQTDALLSGLDDWLLDKLGLQLPKKAKRACFAVKLGEARTRFDADFHSPNFKALRGAIENSGFPVVTVGEVTQKIQTGFASGRQDQADDAESGVPHIRPMNITPNGEFTLYNSKFVPRDAVSKGDCLQAGEVLFNNTNSTAWVGKTAVFDGKAECACSNHITRLSLREENVNPNFLAALFNALRSTGLFGLLSTNFNNQAGINAYTLENFRFPLPPLDIQESIAEEILARREQARILREEAAREWDAAKAHFEAQLLGGSTPGGDA